MSQDTHIALRPSDGGKKNSANIIFSGAILLSCVCSICLFQFMLDSLEQFMGLCCVLLSPHNRNSAIKGHLRMKGNEVVAWVRV